MRKIEEVTGLSYDIHVVGDGRYSMLLVLVLLLVDIVTDFKEQTYQ